MTSILKFLRLPFSQKRLLLRALCLLTVIRLALFVLPFRFTRFILQRSSKPFSGSGVSAQSLKDQMSWSVEVAARTLPFGENCLAKAIVTLLFFRRAHTPAILHIGVNKTGAKPLEAHAWVESEGQIVTGRWDRGLEYQPLTGAGRIFL